MSSYKKKNEVISLLDSDSDSRTTRGSGSETNGKMKSRDSDDSSSDDSLLRPVFATSFAVAKTRKTSLAVAKKPKKKSSPKKSSHKTPTRLELVTDQTKNAAKRFPTAGMQGIGRPFSQKLYSSSTKDKKITVNSSIEEMVDNKMKELETGMKSWTTTTLFHTSRKVDRDFRVFRTHSDVKYEPKKNGPPATRPKATPSKNTLKQTKKPVWNTPMASKKSSSK
jgi:hypothetical protein